jgi:hypothetical protein
VSWTGGIVERSPFTDPDAAARILVEIANSVEAVQDDRIFIEQVNAPFLRAGGSGDQQGDGYAYHLVAKLVARRLATTSFDFGRALRRGSRSRLALRRGSRVTDRLGLLVADRLGLRVADRLGQHRM